MNTVNVGPCTDLSFQYIQRIVFLDSVAKYWIEYYQLETKHFQD